LPSGCTYSSETVTCSRNSTTIDSYDFGLHATTLFIADGVSNTTISNNNFYELSNVSGSGGYLQVGTFRNGVTGRNHFGASGALAILADGAVATITYNVSHGAYEDDWDINAGCNTMGTCTGSQFIFKYNLWWGPKGVNVGPSVHPDGIQFNYDGGVFNNAEIMHDTYYNPSPDGISRSTSRRRRRPAITPSSRARSRRSTR
jgi:hypothetical protein